MASLQTLRNKGGVIVAVVIGFALLAFVLGDLMTSGSQLFGASKNNVGEIDGKTISFQEYSNQLDYLTEIQKISSGDVASTDEQTEALREQTWEQMVRQYAFKPSLEKAGITVPQEELVLLISGSRPSPIIMQMFANPQTGQFDSEYLRTFITNIGQDKSGRMQMFWTYLGQEVSDQAQLLKFKNLVDKSAYVTTFEAEKLAALEGKSYSVRFIADRYTNVADSTVVVSDSEAKSFYEKYKKTFKTGNTRTVDYVVFQALPSDSDYAAADSYIKELVEEFTQNQNVTQFASLNSQSPLDTRYYKEGELTGELGTFAFTATTEQIYGPELSADQYTVARISDIRILADSVNFSHIAFMPTQKATADSLAAELRKKGSDFAAAAAQYSQDKQSSDKGGVMGTVDPQTMPEVFSTPLMKAKKGDILVVETPQSLHLIKVNEVKGESKKVQLATIKYTIEPSEATRNQAYSNANTFAGEATSNFEATVAAKAIAKRTAVINPNDRNVQGLPQSRELARWAYTGVTKDVSKVMEFGDNFVVATITKSTEEGFAPFEEARAYIVAQLTEQKKGEMLAAKMAGATSLDELAAKLSLNIIETTDVNFMTYIAPEVGLDPSFAGGICGMDNSKLSRPIVGRMAVYAAQIMGMTETPISMEVGKARLVAENQQRAFMTSYQAFLEMSKITDLRYRFY